MHLPRFNVAQYLGGITQAALKGHSRLHFDKKELI
jgi:hypothetical protein